MSSETRVRILELLRQQPLCVNALARRLGVSQAAVSQHLRLLKDAGVVESERRGSFVHYSLCPERFQTLLAFLEDIAAGA